MYGAAARLKALRELAEERQAAGVTGPWCPLNGHAFEHNCRECSDFWGTSAGIMVWQYWKDYSIAVGDL